MKFKFRLFVTMLAAAVFAGCSTDDESLNERLVSENSNVEISLGLASDLIDSEQSMRAMVESDGKLNFSLNGENGGLGIYCLSSGKLSSKTSIPEMDWTVSTNNVCMDNVFATAQPKNLGHGMVTQIQWDDHYYYPMGGWYTYRFYGYYPRVAKPKVNAETVTVDYELDGTQDVIWGKTLSGNYSASYFVNRPDDIPQLGLKHCLTCLKFRAVAGDSNGGETVESRGIHVTEISVVNVPVHQTLTIADRQTPTNEGTLKPAEGAGKGVVYLRDDIGGSGYLNGSYAIKSTHTNSKPLVIGNGVMLPPSDRYYVKVTMSDKYGVDCSPKGYYEIALTDGGFEAGKIYWIQMRISAQPENAQGGIEIVSD